MSVEFQLVGNLTLRQFAYLAFGGVLVFLLFILPLVDWLKWPLIVLIGGFSLSLAYLPINDITLDRWVVAFFRAINSPTKRIWRREIKELSVLTEDVSHFSPKNARPAYNPDRSRLNEYLATLRASAPKSELDAAEEAYLASLPFEEGGPPPSYAPKPQPLGVSADLSEQILPPTEPRVVEEDLTKPSQLTPAVRPIITVHMPNKNIYVKKVSTTTVNRTLHSLSSLEGTIVLPVRGERTFGISEDLKKRLYPEEATVAEATAATETPPAPPAPTPAPPPLPEPVVLNSVPEDKHQAPQTDVLEMEKKLAEEAERTRQELQAKKAAQPEEKPAPAKVAAPPPPPPAPIEPKEAVTGALPAITPEEEATVPTPDKIGTPPPKPVRSEPAPAGTVAPQPAIGKMAPPAANVPNVVVGLVRDNTGMLLVEVVIIVKDPDGEPVRALKTNKVGQFAISTPLPNGDYTIELQKPGFKFDTIAVKLDGQIFQPIEIRSI